MDEIDDCWTTIFLENIESNYENNPQQRSDRKS